MKIEMTTVYYNWIPGSTTAFPEGFRMITPGEEVFDEGVTSGASELEISISFQSCWDGMHLDSADHMSHVAFPLGEEEDAPCPSSHPVRIPRLDFFIRWFNTADAEWQFLMALVRSTLTMSPDGTKPFYRPSLMVTMVILMKRLHFAPE